MGHALDLGVVEEDVAAADEGRAVVEQQRRAGGEARDKPVPHHPAAGSEVEQPVARLHVAVQLVLLQVLQQGAARAVHDALRHAGGAGGVHDVERMVERQPLEADILRAGVRREELRQRHAVLHRGEVAAAAGIRHDDDALERRHFGGDLGYLAEAVDRLAVVPVAVTGEQHFRPDLAETVEHALHAEVRRGRGKDGAYRGGGQHRHHGGGQVGQVGGDAVALVHAHRAQGGGRLRHGAVQLGMAGAALDLVLAPEDQGVTRVVAAQQVLGEVQARVGEPLRPRHPVGIDERTRPALIGNHPGEVPQRGPELFRLRHRPAVQRLVVGEFRSPAPRGGAHEGGQFGGGDALPGGLPEGYLVTHVD